MSAPVVSGLDTSLTAIAAGVAVLITASKIKVPTIALLLIAGIALGPFGIGIIDPSELGTGLSALTQLAVAIILFHGGLALNPKGFVESSAQIRRLLSSGMLAGWLVSSVAIKFIAELEWGAAFLASSLVVVTGPTVIMPLLRRLRVKASIHNTLLWEGVLIDPVGVFLATLCYEVVVTGSGGWEAAAAITSRLAVGTFVGGSVGLLADRALRRGLIPKDLVNLFALALAAVVFGVCEHFVSEAGVLGVIVTGFVLALLKPPHFHEIERFKSEISELLISVLFLLLTANLDLTKYVDFGIGGFLSILAVLFLARPANVMVSTWGLDVPMRDRVFLSWVAPRGIVAASMASLFAQSLRGTNAELADFIELFTFGVIAITVLGQGLTAGPISKLLKVRAGPPKDWVIIGAHSLGRGVARWIEENGLGKTTLIDTNSENIARAWQEGRKALRADATDPQIFERDDLNDIGYVLALTDNERINSLACREWERNLSILQSFRWATHKNFEGLEEGTPVWTGMPAPSVLSAELDQHFIHWSGLEPSDRKARLLADAAEQENDKTRLLSAVEGAVQFGQSEAELCLDLIHESAEFVRYVKFESSGVVPAEQLSDKYSVIRYVLEQTTDKHPEIPVETTFRDLKEREKAFATVIGNGVAIPHAAVENLAQPIVSIGQLEHGVSFDSDSDHVKIVILILGPSGNPTRHLNILAEIARLASDQETVQKLHEAADEEEMERILRWSHLDS